jgi:hypothetical protein
MRLHKLVIPLALVLALVLMVGTMYAVAKCGQGAGQGTAGCAMKANAGCGMKTGGGGCGMGICRGMKSAKTRALSSGQVALAATPRGLVLLVTDRSHQGDANVSVTAYGMGPGKEAGFEPRRMGPGRFALMGDPEGLTEVAVRVSKAATSEIVYFGMPTVKAGAGCQATADGSCSMMAAGKCAKAGDCKAKGAGCPMQEANQAKGCGGGCGGGK